MTIVVRRMPAQQMRANAPQLDPFAELKARQREGWKHYAELEIHTIRTAAHLVRVAQIEPGMRVLDVACGTGVVGITARRQGADVAGLDLTPALLERARQNASIAEVDDIDWREGDVEAMPFDDATFDVVLSQFGHIFAPRPEVALAEMLRVLRPGGTLAFSTWPPEAASGALFSVTARHMPPPPGAAHPLDWGRVDVVQNRLGAHVRDLYFERGVLEDVCLSPQHQRIVLERTLAPLMAVMEKYRGDAAKTAAVRAELDAALSRYHRDNRAYMEYLVTRAIKA